MDPASGAPAPPRWPAWAVAAAALAAVAFYFHAELGAVGRVSFPLDDSWIHLQFAKNLAAGHGLSFNPGELSTGATAPLWTALLALGFLIPGGPLLGSKLLGVALHLVAVDATRRLTGELGGSAGLALLASGLTLATYWLVWSALSGMEIPLFLALTTWGMIFHLRERRDPSRLPLALPLLALAALARPEALLLLALAVADRLVLVERGEDGLRLARPPWREIATGLGLAAVLLLPTLLFYQLVGGSIFPATFAVKAEPELRLPNLRFLHTMVGIFFKPQPWMLLAAGAGVVHLAGRLGRRDDHGLLLPLWTLALPLAYSTLSAPGATHLFGNFGRYFFPLFPPLIVLGVLGITPIAALFREPWRRPGLRLATGTLLLALLAWPTVADLLQNADFYAINVENIADGDVRLGELVAAHLPPGALLALEDIGAVGFLAPNPVLDLVGLVSPEVRRAVHAAQSPADPYGERGLVAVLEARKPDFLAAFSNFRPRLTADASRYRPLLTLDVRNNITLAGDRMVLYATPWCRYPPPAFPAP